ncbi:unnamed protein product [Clavelina lepadiformis]|uniref:MFS transporter n=1 Tax=Clavelina lepadiformis TaxID=159417 RepID=A0ABP0G812_CLALP
MQSSNTLGVVILLCVLSLTYNLSITTISIIPSVLWKSHLESHPHLYNASNNGITTIEGDMLQNIEDARKAFIATQGVKISSIFICKMAVQVVTDMFVGPLIHRIGYKVPMFAGTVVMTLSAIGFALAKSYPALFVSVAIQGIGASCNVVGGMTMLVSTVTDKNQRRHVIRLSLSSILLRVAIVPWSEEIVGTFQDKIVKLCIVTALIALHGLFLLLFNIPKIERNEKAKQPVALLPLLNDNDFSRAGVILVVIGLVLGTLTESCSVWSISGVDLQWQTVLAIFSCGIALAIRLSIMSSRPRFPLRRWMGTILGLFTATVGLTSFPLSLRLFSINSSTITLTIGFVSVATNIYPNLTSLAEENHNSNYAAVYALADPILNFGVITGLLVTSGILPVTCIYPVLMLIMPCAYLLYVKFIYG